MPNVADRLLNPGKPSWRQMDWPVTEVGPSWRQMDCPPTEVCADAVATTATPAETISHTRHINLSSVSNTLDGCSLCLFNIQRLRPPATRTQESELLDLLEVFLALPAFLGEPALVFSLRRRG